MANNTRSELTPMVLPRQRASARRRPGFDGRSVAKAFITTIFMFTSLDPRYPHLSSPTISVHSFQLISSSDNNRNRLKLMPLSRSQTSSFATPPRRILRPYQIHQKVDVPSYPSPTALQLFFDKFLQPYGVTNNTNDEENVLNESQIELLNMLLPRIPTPEEKRRIIEGFQRARLDEQLRLSKLSKNYREGGDDDKKVGGGRFLENDEEEGSKMTDLFQRARLAEQLRLSKLHSLNNNDTIALQLEGVLEMGNFFPDANDKDEAFHRALLEERLKIRRQGQQFVTTSDSIEKAMMEYENGINEEAVQQQQQASMAIITMVHDVNEEGAIGNNSDDRESADFVAARDSPSKDSLDLPGKLSNNNNDNTGDVRDKTVISVNQTDGGEDDVKLKQLQEQLEGLQSRVDEATSSPASRGCIGGSNLEVSTSTKAKPSSLSLQNFLSTTYLPLPPREDASFLSLTLAPMAHLVTAMFLFGAGAFYAVMAILDVIWNDNQDEHSTRACLKEASSVVPKCLDYVFPYDDVKLTRKRGAVLWRTMRAMQTSCIASFYAVKCIFLRAAKYSRYSSECMEAGTGALRYLVYAMRAASVLWSRAFESLKVYYQNRRYSKSWNRRVGDTESSSPRIERNNTWKKRLIPLRIVSKITGSAARRVNRQRQLQAEQKLQVSEDMYNKKLRSLNLDRVALERDRQELQGAKLQLKDERRKLLSEGVNVLAWYSAAMEAQQAAAAEGEEKVGKQQGDPNSQKKKGWPFWRADKEKQ